MLETENYRHADTKMAIQGQENDNQPLNRCLILPLSFSISIVRHTQNLLKSQSSLSYFTKTNISIIIEQKIQQANLIVNLPKISGQITFSSSCNQAEK